MSADQLVLEYSAREGDGICFMSAAERCSCFSQSVDQGAMKTGGNGAGIGAVLNICQKLQPHRLPTQM